jgi:hypothetical protein
MITKTELKEVLDDLYDFLLEENAVNAYITAVESDEDNFGVYDIYHMSRCEWIAQVFVFGDTKEGHFYWTTIDRNWLHYLETH